jgi:hypothetical protein
LISAVNVAVEPVDGFAPAGTEGDGLALDGVLADVTLVDDAALVVDRPAPPVDVEHPTSPPHARRPATSRAVLATEPGRIGCPFGGARRR